MWKTPQFFCRFYGFFAKMAAKTTSGCSLQLRFEFHVLDFSRNDIHIHKVCVGLFEIYKVKFQNFKNYSTELQKLFTRIFVFSGHCGILSLSQNLAISQHESQIMTFLYVLMPIFAISRNRHILGLIFPEWGELRPSSFHR